MGLFYCEVIKLTNPNGIYDDIFWTKTLITDVMGRPIPQYYDPLLEHFVPMTKSNVGARIGAEMINNVFEQEK